MMVPVRDLRSAASLLGKVKIWIVLFVDIMDQANSYAAPPGSEGVAAETAPGASAR